MKNLELITVLQSLNQFADKKLPQKLAYAITKNTMTLQKEYEIYQAQLDKILGSYSDYFVKENDTVVVADNGLPVIDDEHREDFNNEISELILFEVDIDLKKVDEEVFDYDDIRYDILTPKEMMFLQKVFCKED